MPYNLTSCGLISACNIFLNAGSSTDENVGALFVQNNFSGANGFGVVVSRNGSGTTAAISIGSDNSNNGLISANNTDLRFGKNQSSTFYEYMRINTSGNVGIGTTSPADNLHVAASEVGNVGISIQNTNASYNPQLRFLNASGTECSAITYIQSNGSLVVNVAGGNRMTINNSGNVGIGTESPNTPLHIVAGSSDGTPLIRLCATTAPSAFNWAGSIMNPYLCNGRNFVLLIGQEQSTKNSGYIGYNHSGTAGSNNNFLTFGHYGNDNLMNLTADGKLGLGTKSPEANLHICTSVNGGTNNFPLIIQNTCTVPDARVGIAFLDNSNTPSSGGSSGAAIQVSNNGVNGTGNMLFQTLLNGTATERMRITSDGNLGIGTTSPTAHNGSNALVIQGGGGGRAIIELWDGTSGKSVFQNVGGDTYIGQLCKGSGEGRLFFLTGGTGNNAQVSMTISCAGNVGIGTSSPAQLLQVQNSTVDTEKGIIILNSNAGTSSHASLRIDGYAGSYIDFYRNAGLRWRLDRIAFNDNLSICSAAVGEVMRFTYSTGNVGINVTAPSTKLHICNPVNQAYSPTSFNSDLHALHIQFCNQNQRAGLIRFTSHGNLENTFGVVQVGCAAFGCGQGDFVFQAYKEAGGVAYNELMRLTNTGNVGIGCSSPGAKLTVGGTLTSTDTITSTSGTVSNILSWTATTGVIGTSTNHALQLRTNDTERLRIDTSGNIGIGTTSPDACTKVQINVAGASCYGLMINKTTADEATIRFKSTHGCGSDYRIGASIYVDSAFEIAQQEINCSRLVIRCTGNIGIGTYTPSYRLHVNGTFYAAGSSIDYKEGICDYDTNSCLFMCLKPVTYQYKDEWKHLGKELKSDIQIGLIAEEVAEVMPELAILVNEDDNKVVRNVDYEKLSIVLLAEVQKLRQEVDQLKK
jgi:hypothetical protein